MILAESPYIVLDGLYFQFRESSGIPRVWSALLEEWSGTAFGQTLLVLDRDGAAPKFPGIHYTPFQKFDRGLAATESFVLEELCRHQKIKLFISTFYTTPLETPSVMMVHDMIPERFPGKGLRWNLEKRFNTYHASGYIAVSNKTAQDLHEDYPVTKEAPLCIAPNGVSTTFRPVPSDVVQAFKKRYGINKPYFLCVGRRANHKNGQLFFNAFARLPDKECISIVCCGGKAVLEPEFQTCIEDNGVHMLNLSDQELNAAYAGALALVYPSTYEGFGLPIIEAMAAGCPVITCPSASIPEVAGEAALYVDAIDTAGMLQGLIDIQRREIREPLIQAGFQRSKLFSWADTAQDIGSFLTEMVHRTGSVPEVRTTSRQRWRELRSYQRQGETTSSERLEQLLRRTELQSHIHQSDTRSETLPELESAWLNSIVEENRRLGNSAGASNASINDNSELNLEC